MKKGKIQRYVIARSYGAGVFAGTLVSRKAEANGVNVILKNARRLWYWDGAASLSQLAMEGTKNPENCKFPCEVTKIEINNVVEILDVTEAARKNIAAVPVWKR